MFKWNDILIYKEKNTAYAFFQYRSLASAIVLKSGI